MPFVEGVGRPGVIGRPVTRPPAGGATFAVAARAAAAPGGPVAAAEVGLAAMLAMQEAESAALRDREARRHGQDILAALAALQRALLGGGAAEDALNRLATLAAAVPEAADPALRAAVAGVTLRARIELARRHAVTGF